MCQLGVVAMTCGLGRGVSHGFQAGGESGAADHRRSGGESSSPRCFGSPLHKTPLVGVKFTVWYTYSLSQKAVSRIIYLSGKPRFDRPDFPGAKSGIRACARPRMGAIQLLQAFRYRVSRCRLHCRDGTREFKQAVEAHIVQWL